jgi:hypothetical protein
MLKPAFYRQPAGKDTFMESLFERLGGTYTLGEDGMYYPDLTLPEGDKPHYGKYGMLRKTFLKEHHRAIYDVLLLEGKLVAHLNEIDEAANNRMDILVAQMQKQQCIDEKLKARDQLAWVGRMNNIRNAAEEIVFHELIYK